jgi:hypothetical protein
MKILKNYNDINLSIKLMEKLEKRWNQWEQPLLLLSFFLHPLYHLNKFNPSLNINVNILGQWVIYYYCVWFENKPTCILLELEDWLEKTDKYPFDMESYNQFDNNILKY